MHITDVIKKPVLSEKTYKGFSNGSYTFRVAIKANKSQIKKSFEEIFEVKVKSVRTLNYIKKDKKLGKYAGKLPAYKKAIITLVDGQKLELLSDL
ncbi:50S ribosomal protein L23 [Spiroplasma endosymbiont of Aspidapion aeneum]|uniref:50S ribosomal protein L23 n=1 Tax=Spiroplasma endosymbiont of Aspidapion aeneum TaxID=3066276 RepID=UPI00313EACB5